MTNNQIAYANYKETVRHNRQTENLGYGQLSEMVRHNVRSEDLGFAQLGETSRHNIVSEDINWYNAEENQRHNMKSETFMQQELGLKATQMGILSIQAMADVGLKYQQAAESGERQKNLAIERKKAKAETALLKARTSLTSAQEILALAKTRESGVNSARGVIEAVKGVASLVGIGD